MSPLEVANTLQIPQRYVFALVSATQAIDAVAGGETVADKTVDLRWKKPQEFFNSILRSLKIA
jgi:hypothetical protein